MCQRASSPPRRRRGNGTSAHGRASSAIAATARCPSLGDQSFLNLLFLKRTVPITRWSRKLIVHQNWEQTPDACLMHFPGRRREHIPRFQKVRASVPHRSRSPTTTGICSNWPSGSQRRMCTHVAMEAARVYSKPLWHVPKALHAGPEVRAHVHCFGESGDGVLAHAQAFGPYNHANMRIGRAGGALGRTSHSLCRRGYAGWRGAGRVWFRYPRTVTSLIEDGIEPFLVALSSRAARAQHPESRSKAGSASGCTQASTSTWRVFSCWRPGAFAPVEVRHDGFCTRAPHGSHLAAAFSGGGDSFVTLFGHTARREPALAPAPQGHGVRALRPRLRHPAGGRGDLPSPRRSAPVVGRLRCRPRRRRVLALG